MNGFKGKFTSIKDISDRRRLPRLGKIRLGVKVKHKTKPDVEYPRETDYFVCPSEVQKEFGEKPKELDIMFPIEDSEIVFPQAYKWFGHSRGLKCIGNGETAMRVNEQGEFYDIECPCEKLDGGECQRRAHLMVIIPKVSVGGVYQIDLGSYHSIVDINSGIDYVKAMIGRFSWVPLILKRVPRQTHGGDKATTHYTLQIEFTGDIDTINVLREDTKRVLQAPRYALPAPIEENPKFDNGATVEYADDEENEKPEPKLEERKQPDPESPIGVHKTLLNQIKNKVIGTNNIEQAKILVPSDLDETQMMHLVNFLATQKKPIEPEEWHTKRDEIVGK